MKILITGGAGFIGSRLTAQLVAAGHDLTILDNLSAQVHGAAAQFPEHLLAQAACIRADVCDPDRLWSALQHQDAVVHLAAETGTGQSMYEITRYQRVNIAGTTTLLDLLVNRRPRRLQKIVVASSRAVYGEGKYQCPSHDVVFPRGRSSQAMSAGRFEPTCPECGGSVNALPTSEDSPFAPSSFYGLTKQFQEQAVLMFCAAVGIDGFALRYQNVYGPGQSLQNSYTGILAVFANLVRQGKTLNIFEDGQESRDFVYVDDVIAATTACLVPDIRGTEALNVGSGVRTTVHEVAHAIREYFASDVPIEISGAFRVGDIRHNVADNTRINALAGYSPAWKFQEGLKNFLAWAENHEASDSGFAKSLSELADRGLLGSTR